VLKDSAVYSVSDINQYIKARLSQDEKLKHISIKGEISNFKVYPTGHVYFSLKDNDSIISAVMFSSYASHLSFLPKNGDEVIVNASIDVYVPRGGYQLMVYEMEEVGRGNILIELEKLKKKLQAEGLFDESRKRPINIYPTAIGVITANNGAAIKDILTNIKRRYPITDIYVFPSSVQGENAPKELLNAFNLSQQYPLTTLIIGRGGGASEDLSAFNDETLVRAIANSKMPVIAAVGHEIDSTLVDFVADKRASTPTGAAELATIDRREIEQNLDYNLERMVNSLSNKVINMKDDLSNIKEELNDIISDKITDLKKELEHKKEHLNSINPKKILERGFSISETDEGKIITSKSDVQIGQKIKTILKDGTLISKVEEK